MHRYRESPLKYSDSDGAASALTESLDEDTDFEFGNDEIKPMNLASRLSQATLTPSPFKHPSKKQSRALLFQEKEDFGLGIDSISISKDTANENVVFGTIEPPRRTNRLRPAASMNLRGDDQGTIKLRTAKSMWALPPQQQQAAVDVCHRPLTVYAERSSKPKRESGKRRMGHIKPAKHQRHEVNGMVFNPETGVWEGGDMDLTAFDTIKGRKEMLIQQQDLVPSQSSTMLFDSKNLCWVPRNEPENDPFAGIDDLAESVSTASTPNLRHSVLSTTSSRRDVSTPADVFAVPLSVQRLWQENDLRFMRKFGRWIEGDDGNHTAANDLYKMVN